MGFLSEWKKYLDFHEAQVAQVQGEEVGGAGQKRREGQKLQEGLFEKVSLAFCCFHQRSGGLQVL